MAKTVTTPSPSTKSSNMYPATDSSETCLSVLKSDEKNKALNP